MSELPEEEQSKTANLSIQTIKIPVDSTKKEPASDASVCALWVFQNCGGNKVKKLRRVVSLVRNRNDIDWLPVTTDGKICIVTYLGKLSDLVKLRSNVFGLGMESFSFVPNKHWIIPPKDITQFNTFFDLVKSDLQAIEKRLLQKREKEIKSKELRIEPTDTRKTESIELTEMDIEDLRRELKSISSL